jgi:hypothetical protein
MRTLILTITALSLGASDIPDLGIISPRRAVVLQQHSSRPDFVSFSVEFLPQAPPTNLVTLTLTNEFLSVSNLAAIPSGPGILGVQAIYADGSKSDLALYRYDLRRGKPAKPSARAVGVLMADEPEKSLTGEITRVREARVILMPALPGQRDVRAASRMVPNRPPLPNGTNRTYAEHLDAIADWGAKRRSE